MVVKMQQLNHQVLMNLHNVVDAGSIVTTQITATLTQQVTDRARIFDFVSGDFDDQPSNFDGDANTQCSSEATNSCFR